MNEWIAQCACLAEPWSYCMAGHGQVNIHNIQILSCIREYFSEQTKIVCMNESNEEMNELCGATVSQNLGFIRRVNIHV